MARAVLQIDGDTSGLAAAFGAATRAAREAEGAARRTGDTYRRNAREMVNAERAVAAAAQHAVSAQVRAEQQRVRAARMSADARKRAEREATRVAQEESRKRGLSAEQEGRVKQHALERYSRLYEQEERRVTATAEREARARSRVLNNARREAARVQSGIVAHGSQIGTGLRRGLNVGGDAAMNVGREAHSQIQDARQRRAATEHTLNAAMFQAGVGGSEGAGIHSRIRQEIATGSLRGFSMEDVSSAILGSQVQFSSITGASAGERARNLDEQVHLMSFARNTYQDPAEVLRVAGMLKQQGLSGGNLMSTIQSMTGMAGAGAIELSTLTGTALGPLMQNVARMTSPTQSPEERAAAVRAATLETMAVGEITSRGGMTPRHALNALATLRGEVESPLMASRLRNRLTNDGRGELADRLTQVDATGRVSLRNRSTIGFMSDLTQGMGGDANAVANLLRSGGSRNAMVLGSPVRTLINAMASQTGSGGTIADKVSEMQTAGSRFGDAEVARGRAMIEGEQKTAIGAAEAVRDNALTDNTSAIVDLSNQLANWTTANPIESSALQAGGGLFGGMLGGALFPRIGRALAGTSVGRLLTGAAGAASGAAGGAATGASALVGRAAGAALGVPALLGAGLSAIGAYGGTEQDDVERQRREGAEWERQSGRLTGAARSAGTAPPTAAEIGAAVAAALHAQPLTATVSPTDAAQAASTSPVATPPAR